MITIFGDFSQFLAKKLPFFLNTNVMFNFFQNLAFFCVKNANFFAKIFGENIFKIITSVPGHLAVHPVFNMYVCMYIHNPLSIITNECIAISM
jgi:hypothetical protein